MSGDPEQEYFSEGITEHIITDLSQISAIFVVARNTAFTFEGKARAWVRQAIDDGTLTLADLQKASPATRALVTALKRRAG